METPPHDPLAERQVLGAALSSRPVADRAAAIVEGSDFYLPNHELIWETIQALRTEGIHPDVNAVSQRLIANQLARLSPLTFQVWQECISPESVEHYAGIVRERAHARALALAFQKGHERAVKADSDPVQVGADITQAIAEAASRDAGAGRGELLEDILAESEDDAYEWVVPGLLAAHERLVLTGAEGGGKSMFLRQLAICVAAGIHPFNLKPIRPRNVLLIDNENPRDIFRRQSRPVFIQANKLGQSTHGRIMVDMPGVIDITQARQLNAIQRMVADHKPALILIGPLYKLRPGNGNTEEEVAPVLFALDTLRETGAAIVTEAHSGNATTDGHRQWRPRGSSVLMGWPEFGFGLERIKDAAVRSVQIMRWRGDREDRDWPTHYRAGGVLPWTPEYKSLSDQAEHDFGPPDEAYDPEPVEPAGTLWD